MSSYRTIPGTGTCVANGKSATTTLALVRAARMLLLPVLGRPSRTTCPAPLRGTWKMSWAPAFFVGGGLLELAELAPQVRPQTVGALVLGHHGQHLLQRRDLLLVGRGLAEPVFRLVIDWCQIRRHRSKVKSKKGKVKSKIARLHFSIELRRFCHRNWDIIEEIQSSSVQLGDYDER